MGSGLGVVDWWGVMGLPCQGGRRTLLSQAGVKPLAMREDVDRPEEIPLGFAMDGVPLGVSQVALQRRTETRFRSMQAVGGFARLRHRLGGTAESVLLSTRHRAFLDADLLCLSGYPFIGGH
jgi:hypothetical protein